LEEISSQEAISLTVSIGVSACREHDTATALVGRADQALCLAKREGKNRVMSEKDLD
jgi:diguanylate cyclase (GGDEF)-like protein